MEQWLVLLRLDEGEPVRWTVKAKDRFNACIEAWRLHRNTGGERDNQFPPGRPLAMKLDVL